MTDRTIRSVCVVGGGVVAKSAALALARALPEVEITLLDQPVQDNALADQLCATLPASRRFHALLGIDEHELIRRGIASCHLATRYENWSASGAPWVHGLGEVGLAANGIPFHQLWARAVRAGEAPPFDVFSLSSVLASAGKFALPDANPGSPLATLDYAVHLHPAQYSALLDELLDRTKICRISGAIEAVNRSVERVAGVVLASGATIAADLYFDCSGPARVLVAPAAEFETWREWLPFDRFSVEEITPAPSPLSAVSARAGGWEMTLPGPASVRISAWRSQENPEGTAICAGRLVEPWCGNVMALGDAAIALDPLLPLPLSLAHNAILRALELLPGRDFNSLELAEYNRRTAQEARRVRDFAALHYYQIARSKPPESLALTLDQFETRGRLPFFEEELFSSHDWLSVLLGLGIIPGAIDPAAAIVGGDVARQAMQRLARSYQAIAAQAPVFTSVSLTAG